MICRKCGTECEAETIGFKATCDHCLVYLHSCLQCSIFDHSAERCRSLTTDAVRSIEDLNFCEEFVPNSTSATDSKANDSVARQKQNFDNLFGKR